MVNLSVHYRYQNVYIMYPFDAMLFTTMHKIMAWCSNM